MLIRFYHDASLPVHFRPWTHKHYSQKRKSSIETAGVKNCRPRSNLHHIWFGTNANLLQCQLWVWVRSFKKTKLGLVVRDLDWSAIQLAGGRRWSRGKEDSWCGQSRTADGSQTVPHPHFSLAVADIIVTVSLFFPQNRQILLRLPLTVLSSQSYSFICPF